MAALGAEKLFFAAPGGPRPHFSRGFSPIDQRRTREEGFVPK